MEQLDAVYNALVNLEKNFAKSKKTREEYLLEKCGGDFDVGPFLILNALSAEEITDPEDIAKLSKVRDILAKIQETRGKHNSLRSFNFGEQDNSSLMHTALSVGQVRGTGITTVTQDQLWGSREKGMQDLHYRATPKGLEVAPIETVKYYSVFSRAMALFVSHVAQDPNVEQGALYERKLGDRVVQAFDVEF